MKADTAKRRLLITGGSGFLGSHLRDAARDRYETFATFFSRPFDGGVRLDICDAPAVAEAFADIRPAVVIHTAYEKASHDVIAAGSANVARAAQAHGARLIHLSTDLIFSGNKGAHGAYREDDAPDPLIPYGQAKHEAEKQVMTHAPGALMVRTSLIYGLDGSDAFSRFVLDGIQTERPVTLFVNERRCPILVADLVQALLELVDIILNPAPPTADSPAAPLCGPLHIAGEESISRYEFGALIARYHGYDTQYLVATTSEAAGMIRPKDCTLDTSKARKMLGTRLRGVSEVLAVRG